MIKECIFEWYEEIFIHIFFIYRINSPNEEENCMCCEDLNETISHADDCEICTKYKKYFNV